MSEKSNQFEQLAEMLYGWNQAAEDGDRGAANNFLCLIIADDGSGCLGTVSSGYRHDFRLNEHFEFDTVDELTEFVTNQI